MHAHKPDKVQLFSHFHIFNYPVNSFICIHLCWMNLHCQKLPLTDQPIPGRWSFKTSSCLQLGHQLRKLPWLHCHGATPLKHAEHEIQLSNFQNIFKIRQVNSNNYCKLVKSLWFCFVMRKSTNKKVTHFHPRAFPMLPNAYLSANWVHSNQPCTLTEAKIRTMKTSQTANQSKDWKSSAVEISG